MKPPVKMVRNGFGIRVPAVERVRAMVHAVGELHCLLSEVVTLAGRKDPDASARIAAIEAELLRDIPRVRRLLLGVLDLCRGAPKRRKRR
jgi:hypothetical protein